VVCGSSKARDRTAVIKAPPSEHEFSTLRLSFCMAFEIVLQETRALREALVLSALLCNPPSDVYRSQILWIFQKVVWGPARSLTPLPSLRSSVPCPVSNGVCFTQKTDSNTWYRVNVEPTPVHHCNLIYSLVFEPDRCRHVPRLLKFEKMSIYLAPLGPTTPMRT